MIHRVIHLRGAHKPNYPNNVISLSCDADGFASRFYQDNNDVHSSDSHGCQFEPSNPVNPLIL